MQNLLRMPRLDKASEKPAGGGMPAPPQVIPQPPQQQPPAETPAPVEATGGDFDDFGYPKAPAAKAPEEKGEKPKEGDPKPKDPAEKPQEVAEPGTGYGDKAPEVPDVVPVVPAVPPTAPDDIDKALEGLPKEEIEPMKAFAIEHKLSPEVMKAWADKTKLVLEKNKIDATNMEKRIEQEKMQVRASWYKELKDDKDFGGANFDRNRLQAEKVLQEFMPQTKKALTSRGSMLPPYVMRDLAKLADHLYATERLTQGDPIVPVVPDDKKDDALDFYTS